jgi:phosphopantetheinyl transferase
MLLALDHDDACQVFFRIGTAKEAITKATGQGIGDGLRDRVIPLLTRATYRMMMHIGCASAGTRLSSGRIFELEGHTSCVAFAGRNREWSERHDITKIIVS